jgi:hypothetical protein
MKPSNFCSILAIVVLSLPLAVNAFSNDLKSPASHEAITWQVISGGGTNARSASYWVNGTAGETAVEISHSVSTAEKIGFWQNWGCCLKAGDANHDGSVNVGDAVFLINYIFKRGVPPTCLNEGDANSDCKINVGDPVFMINYIFKAGNAPSCGCLEW